MNKNQTNLSYRTTKAERLSYWTYFLGQNIFYGLVAVNMQTYYADIGITAASIAIILFITKVWDAVNDPLFGILIDKLHFKKGRFLPWLRIALPAISLSSIIFFAIPQATNPVIKTIWATVAYIAWDASYTLCDVPIFVMPTTMTDNIKERGQLLTMGRYFAMIGVSVAAMALPMLQKRLGWMICGLVFSVIGALFMIPLCLKGKERFIVPMKNKDASVKEMVRYVIQNKYLLVFYIAMFVGSVTNFTQYVQVFFARYNLGNQDVASMLSLLSMIPMLLVGAILPTITKHMDKFILFAICQIGAIVLGVVRYFAGYDNMTLFYVLTLIHGIFAGANNILLFTFTPDCLEYGTYHTGERAEGIAASVQTFFSKLVGSISGPVAMLILSAFGFVSGENAIQTLNAQHGIWLCFTLLPALGTVLMLGLLSKYKLRDKDVQIMAKFNMGEISKEEAEVHLLRKFGPAAEPRKTNINM